MLERFKKIYTRYPKNFWTLIFAMFVDRIGGSLIFPFLSLYITGKFNVGMTQVGTLFAIHSISAFFGNMVGGALTDKLGRRTMLMVGLVVSAGISLTMGFVQDWKVFFIVMFLTGFVSNIGGPAVQAMLADILPESQRAEGFGIYRVAFNLSATIGPAIGGVLAGISYLLLFIIDCVISVLTATFVYFTLPETKPEEEKGQEKTVFQTVAGYGEVFRDKVFLAFLILATFTALVYMQMNTTLSVYLRDNHAISAQYYGYILSLNAGMVVLFQFWVTRRVKSIHPLVTMAIGSLFYAVGFSMYGYLNAYWMFLVAMAIITVGEMIIAPVAQTLIADIAPVHMRGRYMAAFQISWGLASSLGPLGAGLIMDNYNPNWVWYAGGIICLIVAAGYITLRGQIGQRFERIQERDAMEV